MRGCIRLSSAPFFPFGWIGKFREDKPCAILVGLYKSDVIALTPKWECKYNIVHAISCSMQWRERNYEWTYEHKRMPNKHWVVRKSYTQMWVRCSWPKTLVHQPSLQTEVPPYPKALATLGMESEVYQKFLHHFMLVRIRLRQ